MSEEQRVQTVIINMEDKGMGVRLGLDFYQIRIHLDRKAALLRAHIFEVQAGEYVALHVTEPVDTELSAIIRALIYLDHAR